LTDYHTTEVLKATKTKILNDRIDHARGLKCFEVNANKIETV